MFLHTFGLVVPTASPSFGPLGKFLFFLRRAPLLRRLPWSTPFPCHVPQTDQQSGLHFLFWVFLLGPAGLGLCNNYIVSVVMHLHVCQAPPPPDYEGNTGRGWVPLFRNLPVPQWIDDGWGSWSRWHISHEGTLGCSQLWKGRYLAWNGQWLNSQFNGTSTRELESRGRPICNGSPYSSPSSLVPPIGEPQTNLQEGPKRNLETLCTFPHNFKSTSTVF